MPYLKALIISELQNDIEIYRYINTKDMVFKNEISDNFMNGLRGGMNELFTDQKKQFEKLQTSIAQRAEPAMAFDDKNENKKGSLDNYEVSIMYDKYFVRKKEIAENVLMIAICDVVQDGCKTDAEGEIFVQSSSFNMGQVDLLFQDYQTDFNALQGTIDTISKNISNQ